MIPGRGSRRQDSFTVGLSETLARFRNCGIAIDEADVAVLRVYAVGEIESRTIVTGRPSATMPTEQVVRVYARSDGIEPFTQWLRRLRDGANRNRIRQRIARIRLGSRVDE